MTLPTIVDQLEAYYRANEELSLCWISAPMARRMGYTLGGLKVAIERGDIPAAKVGRSGRFCLTRATVERFTRHRAAA
ncbi:MAG TPA: hypothetical protein VJ673_14295 [Aromatoleum sp.]|uniref:hypothetical protein n=1 Tax=Aromatoleum sp. TaxID=2307007 RepID=UPI002B48A030|nr:hypothetical protein [Aromatoleum sp.]HJV26855.1 hypothetical protein [Aromatoleum sp.]